MSRSILATLAAASTLLVAACGTTPEETPAAVEARTPGAGEPASRAQAQPLGRTPAARADVAPGTKSAARDAGSVAGKRSIYYDYDRFDVKEEYRGTVEAHAKHLRENPSAKLRIQGHADERGSREYNLALGQRRAESVKKLSVLLGAREDQIEAVSLGEEKPACAEHGEQCWWQNRRGDIRYPGEY